MKPLPTSRVGKNVFVTVRCSEENHETPPCSQKDLSNDTQPPDRYACPHGNTRRCGGADGYLAFAGLAESRFGFEAVRERLRVLSEREARVASALSLSPGVLGYELPSMRTAGLDVGSECLRASQLHAHADLVHQPNDSLRRITRHARGAVRLTGRLRCCGQM
jgi:hypothetical protein